ncbi:hypothetical protein PBRA_008231 [Plasmodiophora brassicae]|uniref:SPIN90/Ldb17 leucine-rich domain-containing protein n=1 Tax=Plasmodiophora brassicae TaxID=37360 RepID=A0A0G4J0N5_PLABS|nr:hypothetical protein PBRA_008231 [Plasmodiophora brassicae]
MRQRTLVWADGGDAAWLEVADSIIQVAQIASVEMAAPIQFEKSVADQTGRNSKGTLWDQQKDEMAVRMLLEEGKLNLTMRLLHQYMEVSMGHPTFMAAVRKAAEDTGQTDAKVTDTCRNFEISCGLLLTSALSHVEALQILDIPYLVKHCQDVIQHGLDNDQYTKFADNQEGMQKSVVVHFLRRLTDQLDELDEERVLEILDSNDMLRLVAVYTSKQCTSYFSRDDIREAVLFFVNVFTCETFKAESDRYASAPVMDALVALQDPVLAPCLQSETDPNRKRGLREVLDRVGQYARKKR